MVLLSHTNFLPNINCFFKGEKKADDKDEKEIKALDDSDIQILKTYVCLFYFRGLMT